MNKKYDFFATSLYQPDLTTDDLYNLGITPANTEMKSKEEYKKIPKVIEHFTENGIFNEEEFNNQYNNSLLIYDDYANKEFQKKVINEFQYDPTDWRAPLGSNRWDTSAQFQLGEKNPTQLEMGIERIGINNESQFSIRELAQMNEVRSITGEKLGWTPNEKGGLFKALDRPSVALAIYTEDGTHEIDGRIYEHKAGDYKLDEYGMPYYEEVGDNDTAGRDMLHYTDTFTIDGSKWNKYDFFDSDGLHKSVGGVIAKTAVSLIPYMIPYVREFWGGLNVGIELAQLVPVLGKTINGIIDNDSEGELIKDLNKLENYMSRFESSTSDDGRRKHFGLETIGNLISSVGSQLFQQRVISMIPTILGDPVNAIRNVKLGQELALAYMAGTSSIETYSSFMEAGASPRVAGLATLANIAALNGLMRIDYFRGTLFKGSYLDDDVIREPARKVAKKAMEDSSKEMFNSKTVSGNKKLLSKMIGWFRDDLEPSLMKTEFVKHSIAEGVEEVMEEVTFDVTKGVTEALNSIGVPVSQVNENFGFNWDIEEMGLRYLTSFVGGTIGGAMFQANNKWEKLLFGNATQHLKDDEFSQLTYLIAEGRGNEIKKYYKKLHDRGLLGSSDLSGSKFQTVDGLDGSKVVAEGSNNGKTQNDMVYEILCRHVDYIESLLSSEGMKIPEKTLETIVTKGIRTSENFQTRTLKAQILNESLVNSGFYNEWNRLGNAIVKKRAELDAVLGIESDAEARSSEPKEPNLKAEQIIKELKELREKRDAILNGDYNSYYVRQGLFVLDDTTNKHFIDLSLEKYTQAVLKKKFEDLTKEQQDEIRRDYAEYMNTEGKTNMYRAFDVYLKMSERYKDRILAEAEESKNSTEDTLHVGDLNGVTYLKRVVQYHNLRNELLLLKEEENPTEEQEARISEIQSTLTAIENEINIFNSNPNTILDSPIEDGINLNVNMGPTSNVDSRKLAQDYILNLYKEYATKKIRVRDESELDQFYSLVKKLHPISIRERFDKYLRSWYESNVIGLDDDYELFASINKYGNNPLFNYGIVGFDSQEKFVSALNKIESNLSSKNGSAAIDAFNEAVSILLEYTTLSEDDAKKLVKELLPNISDESIIDFVQQIEDFRHEIKFSSIPDLLSDIYSDITGDNSNIVQLLTLEENRLASLTKVSDYLISSESVKTELEDVQKFLKAIKGLIVGASNGLNRAGNSISKVEQHLAELDEQTAKMLYRDIHLYEEKIGLLLALHEANRIQKLRLQKDIMCKLKPQFIQYLLEPEFAATFEQEFGFNIINLFNSINQGRINLNEVNDDNFHIFEQVSIEFEDELYNKLHSIASSDLVKKIVNCFGNDIAKMESTVINSDTKFITAFDMAFYIANLSVLKSSSFYGELAKHNQDSKFAPILGQELAIRYNISLLANPELYNELLTEIKSKYNGTNNYMKNKDVLYNTSISSGGAGTGKTTAIAKNSILMAGDDVEYIVIAPKKEQVDKFKKDLGIDCESYTSDEFFKKAVGGWSDDNISFTDDKRYKISVSYTGDRFFKTQHTKRVFLIDEATLFDVGQWMVISTIARGEGAVVWGLGDTKQNSATIRINNGLGTVNHNASIEDFYYMHSPLLSTPLRPNFSGKSDNSVLLDTLLTLTQQKVSNSDSALLSDYDREISSLLSTGSKGSKLTLQYWEDDSVGVIGEKFITEDEVSNYLVKLSKIGTVLYVSDDDVVVPEGVEKRSTISAQGGEFDFVVINKKWPSVGNSKYNAVRDLYTLTQRSSRGSVIVDNGIKDYLGLDNIKKVTVKQNISIGTKDIDEFKEWRFAGLNDLVYDDLDEFIVRDSEVPPPVSSSQIGQVQVTPPSQTQSTGNVTQQPAQPNVQPVQPVQPNANVNSSVNPPINPIPATGVIAGPITPSPRARIYEETVGSANIYGGRFITMDEGNFYSWMASKYFIEHEKTVENSLHSIIPLEGNTEQEFEAYKSIVTWISAAIKLNRYRNEQKQLNINDIYHLLSLSFIKKLKPNQTKMLQDILMNDVVETHLIPFNGRTLVVARFVSLHGNVDLEIPIGMMNIVRYGKYNGSFKIKQQVKKGKSDPGNVRMTINEFQRAYPGITVIPSFGILSVPDNIQYWKDSRFNDGTRNFIRMNNGKVMIAVTDNPIIKYFYENSDIFKFGIHPGDGSTYLIDDPEYSSLVGIHRSLTIGELIQFAMLRHARHTNTHLTSAELNILDIQNPVELEKRLSGTEIELPEPPQNQNKERWKTFRSTLDSRQYQIMPKEYSSQLFGELFTEGANNTDFGSMCRHIFKECLIQLPARRKNGSVERMGVKFKVGNDEYFVSNTLSTDGRGNFELSLIKLTDNGPVVMKNGNNAFTFTKMIDLYRALNISENNRISSAEVCHFVRESNGNFKGVFSLSVNEQLYYAFKWVTGKQKGVLSTINSLFETSKFKYGLYVQDVGGKYFSSQSYFRRFNGNSSEYTMDVANWSYSQYTLDLSTLQTESGEGIDSKENDRITYETRVDELKSLLKNKVAIESIIDSINNSDMTYLDKWFNLVQSINNMLLILDPNSIEYMNIEDTNSGLKITTKSKPVKFWIDSLIKDQGLEVNEVIYNFIKNFKCGIFSVSSGEIYSIFYSKDGWKIQPFKTFNLFEELMQLGTLNKDVLNQECPNFGKYLLSTLFDSKNNKYAEEITRQLQASLNPEIQRIKQKLINYLETRLLNNEC